MPSALHPASAFHAPNTVTRNEFKEALAQVVGYSTPSAVSKKYQRVRVLLVQGENDTLGVEDEILGLKQVFTNHYRYSAQIAKIPSTTKGPSTIWLNKVMMDVLTDMTDQDSSYSTTECMQPTTLATYAWILAAKVLVWLCQSPVHRLLIDSVEAH